MKHEMKKKIVSGALKECKGNLNQDQIMDVLTTVMYDFFKTEKKLRRVVMWNWILIFLLVLDVLAFWLPKLIK